MDSRFFVQFVEKNINQKLRSKSKSNLKSLKNIFFILSIRDKQNHLLHRKLTQVALINVKQSARFSSCTIVLLMLIIIIGSLITKWLLLQPIHNELVNKYNQNESIYYERNTFCNLIDLEDFNMLTFPITCFLILLFIIFSQRTSCMRGKCKGYFAPILPLDFYIHIKRKFAAVIFAIIADELLNILNEVFTESDSSDQGRKILFHS